MKFAEMLIQDAKRRGLEHVFGIPGSGFPMDAMEAGRKAGIESVHVAHESTAAIAAAYYGVTKGTSGLAIGVKGVGAGNMVGGVSNVYFERMPVLCVFESGPTDSNVDLVQVADHDAMFGSVTKFQATLQRETASQVLGVAISESTHGRPGPVVLNVPLDFDDRDCGRLPPLSEGPSLLTPQEDDLQRARSLISKANNPVVIAGADVIREQAIECLDAFVNATGAAVLVSMEARGAYSELSPRWAGVLLGSYAEHCLEREIGDRADLFIFIGVDSLMTHAPWPYETPTIELVQRADYRTMSPCPQVRVNGSLRESITLLTDLRDGGFPIEEIESVKKGISSYFKRPKNAKFAIQDIVNVTRSAFPSNGILVSETGAFITVLEHMWQFDKPGQFFGTAGGRTMGLMIPAAIGIKLAAPDVPVIGIGADGSTLMRMGELEAFARLKISVPLVVVNDKALGTMKSRQKSRGMKEYGLDIAPVDYAAVARACGLNGVIVETPDDFRNELRRALDSNITTLIDARVDQEPYWDGFALSIGAIPEDWSADEW